MSIQDRKVYPLIIFGFLVLLSFGCEKIEKLNLLNKNKALQPQGTVIAKVADLPITLEQLEQEIQGYNELTDVPGAKINTREQRIAYLNEELIRRHLLYLEAVARNFDNQPKVQETLRNLEINVLANQFIQDEIKNVTVTSSEIEDFYNLYKDQFQQEEERRIKEILVSDETTAKEILIELLKGADFATLAKERSIAPTAANGGDLGFIKKGARGADFARFDIIAFSSSLEVGQNSNVFKDKSGYYIVKLEGKKGGQPRPLSEVWDEIKTSVLFLKQQQKIKEITDNLAKKIKVVVYEDRIK